MVAPDLKVVSKAIVVEVIQDDAFLSGVSVPPFVLSLEVGAGIMLAGVRGLSNSGGSVNPHSSNVIGGDGLLGGNVVAIKIFLELQVLTDRYYTVGDSLLGSHRDEFLISSLEVSLDIALGRLNARSPRAFYSRVLLVAILVRAIIKLD